MGMPQAEAQAQGTTGQDQAPATEESMLATFNGEEAEVTEGQQEFPADSANQTQTEPVEGEQQEQAEPVIDIGGEKVKLSDVQAWREAHGKVTQEFQTVAKMRRELEPYVGLRNALRQDKELASAVLGIMERGSDKQMLQRVLAAMAGQQIPQAGQAPANPLEQKLQTMEQRLQEFQMERQREAEDRKVAQEFDSLRNSNPELKALSEQEWSPLRSKVAEFMADHARQGRIIPADIAYAYLSKNGAVAVAAQAGMQAAQKTAAQERKAPAPKIKGGSATGAPARGGGEWTDERIGSYFK